MSLLNELHAGNFRGASFLIKTATTVGGRKQVKHEYPNSPRQKIEDLGFQPRNFKIKAIIAADPPNQPGAQSYLQKRNALLEALEVGGPGTLSHPYFSNSIEVVARPYTLIEDTTSLDKAEIDLEFDLSDRFTDPQPQSPSLSEINLQRQAVFSSVNAAIADNWVVSTADNFESAESKLNGFSDFVDSTTQTFNQDINEIDAFAQQLSDFSSDITQLIQNPDNLAESVVGIYSSTAGLYQTIDAAVQVFVRFFNFGDDDVQKANTTPERTERNRNDNLINGATQASYLALTYEFAAQNEYTTVEDINNIQELMEDQYQKLVDTLESDEVIDSLNDLRTLANSWLRQQRLNAAQLITVNVKQEPASVLGYRYYGDVDNFNELVDTIIDQNRPASNDVTFLEGDIEILTT